MALREELVIGIVVDALGAIKGFRDAKGNLVKLDRALKDTKKSTQSFSSSFSKMGSNIVVANQALQLSASALRGVKAAFNLAAGAAKGFIDQAAEFEQADIAFTTILGSAELAQEKMEELFAFAAKTPFTIPGIQASAKQLLAVGITAEDLIPTLKALGDVSAGLSVPLSRLALNFGQVKTQGKLTGRELRDFAVSGVPLTAILSKTLEKSRAEIAKMVSAGKIGFKDVENAFKQMTSGSGRFADLMIKQSKSFKGIMSNLEDQIILLSGAIGKELLPEVKELALDLVRFLEVNEELIRTNLVEFFRSWIPVLRKIADQIFRIIPPILKFLGATAKVIDQLNILAGLGSVLEDPFARATADVLILQKNISDLENQIATFPSVFLATEEGRDRLEAMGDQLGAWKTLLEEAKDAMAAFNKEADKTLVAPRVDIPEEEGEQFKATVGSVLERFGETLTVLGRKIENSSFTIFEAFEKLAGTTAAGGAEEGVAGFGQGLQAVGATFAKAAQSMTTGMISFIIALPKIISKIQTMSVSFLGSVGKVLDNRLGKAKKLTDVLFKIMKTGISLAKNLIKDVMKQLDRLITGFVNMFDQFTDGLDSMLDSIPKMFEKISENAVKVVRKFFKSLVTAMPKFIRFIVTLFVRTIPRLLKTFNKFFPLIIEAMADGMVEGAKEAGLILSDIFKGKFTIEPDAEAFSNIGAKIMEGASDQLFAVRDLPIVRAAQDEADKLKEAIKDSTGIFIRGVLKAWRALVDFVKGAIKLVEDRVFKPMANIVKNAFQPVIDKVITPLQSIGQKGFQWVKEKIIDPLFNDQPGWLQKFREVVRDFFRDTPEWVTKFKDQLKKLFDFDFGSISGGGSDGKILPGGPFNKGGAIMKLARGGKIPGFQAGGGVDSVPALLTPGEFVINRNAVDALGLDALRGINQGQVPVNNANFGDIIVNVANGSGVDAIDITNRIMDEIRQKSLRGEFVISDRGIRKR